MSKVVKGITGGSSSKSSSSSKSGFSALPSQLRKPFINMGLSLAEYTDPRNAGVVDRFTPMDITGQEQQALGMMGLTGDALTQSIQGYQSPYNDIVIGEMNRQAAGDANLLRSGMSDVGGLGSNREFLGMNDIDLARQGMIGQFLNQGYNQAVGMRQQDIQNLMGAGEFQRNLGMQQQLAPIQALQAGTGMMSPFLSGSSSNSSSKSSSYNGIGDTLGKVGGMMTGASLLFSDERLKQDISHVGEENGHRIYEFGYIGDKDNKRYRGVMAQDVEKVAPDAVVVMANGYKAVDYAKIGVEFKEV